MTALLPLLLLGALSGHADAQAPTTQPAPQTTPAPQPPAPRPRAQPSAGNATATLTVNVSDGGGLPVQGVDVHASGPLDREGSSLAGGIVRFLNLKGGEYRLRFAHPKFVLLERDVTMRGGVAQTIDVTLSPAPDAPAPVDKPSSPPPTTASTAPAGEPTNVSIPDFIEKNFIGGRDAVKEDPMGCTASAKTVLVQVRDSLPERALPDQDETILVVYGEGSLRLGNRDIALSSKALSLAVVPRGTVRGITRKGRNPLIFVSVLSGPPCTR